MKFHAVAAVYLKGDIIVGTSVSAGMHAGGVMGVTAAVADVGTFGDDRGSYGQPR